MKPPETITYATTRTAPTLRRQVLATGDTCNVGHITARNHTMYLLHIPDCHDENHDSSWECGLNIHAEFRPRPRPVDETIARVDAVINDLDNGDPDSAQVAADMRTAIETTTLRDNARITQSYRQLSEQVNATTPDRILAIDGPLSAAEAEAIRDLVTAQPGGITDMPQLNDATIAELRASIQRQLTSIVTPTADAAFAVRGAYEDRFLDDEPPPPITYDQMHDLIRRLGPLDPPPEPIQLTDEQFDQIPKAPPREPWEPAPSPLLGISVHRVDTVEESTPYRLERARHIAEQHVELCGCTWDHPANVEPTRPGWLRRAIRRLLR